MRHNANALGAATQELRGDREIVMTAVSQSGWTLQYASKELRGDREVVMTAVSRSGWVLQFAAEELRGDREVVMTAVSQNGSALRCASEELRGDRAIVMKAVSQSELALRYATEELKGDHELLEIAVQSKRFFLAVVKVTLLSGRSCTVIIPRRDPWSVGPQSNSELLERVLRECARLLDLDPDHVAATGTLLQVLRASTVAT